MVQGGEHHGRDEQHPWMWTFESDPQPTTSPQRSPSTPKPVDEWSDEPFVAAGQARSRPLSPAPALRGTVGDHRRATNWLPRRTRRIAGGLALVLLGAGIYYGIDTWLIGNGSRFTVPAGCTGQVQLRLAVAPQIAPLVERASAEVDKLCPTLAITPLEPGQTAAILADGKVDGMVAASSAWLRLAPAPAAKPGATPSAVPGATPSAAPGPSPQPASPGAPPAVESAVDNAVSLVRSPIVVAMPRPAAEALGWPQRQPSWAELTAATVGGKLRLSMANPMRDAAGLLAVLGVHTAMGKTTPDQGIAQMRALTLRSRLADDSADPAALLKRLESMSDPAAAIKEVGAFPVTEQALWAHQAKKPAVPLAGIYPRDGLLEADYPLALAPAAAADGTLKDIAARLIGHFRSATFAATIREHGFRSATGAAPAAASTVAPSVTPAATPTSTPTSTTPPEGLLAEYPAAAATPSDPALVNNRAAQWARYQRLNFQVLILLDASASMNNQVRDRSGTLTTKAALLRTAGVQAAQLFGLDTSVGVWLFATPAANSPPYVEAVSFGPLDEPVGGVPRREVVRRMAENYNAYEKAGTPLYETVLRGVNAMRQRVKPGTVTMVVALTDGRDEDTSFAMPRAEFLSRLNAARDPQRPVPVFGIGYGADADMEALNDISRATGGRAAASNDPGDLASAMAQIFLAAHAAQ